MKTDLWDSVMKKAEGQRKKGLSKYGTPVTADETVDWLNHAVEEQLDSAVYMEAAKSVIEQLKKEVADLEKDVEKLLESNSCLFDKEKAFAKERESLEAALKEKEQWVYELDASCEKKEQLLASADREIETLREQVKEAEKRRSDSEAARTGERDWHKHIVNKLNKKMREDEEWAVRKLTELRQSEGRRAATVALVSLIAGLLLGFLFL